MHACNQSHNIFVGLQIEKKACRNMDNIMISIRNREE